VQLTSMARTLVRSLRSFIIFHSILHTLPRNILTRNSFGSPPVTFNVETISRGSHESISLPALHAFNPPVLPVLQCNVNLEPASNLCTSIAKFSAVMNFLFTALVGRYLLRCPLRYSGHAHRMVQCNCRNGCQSIVDHGKSQYVKLLPKYHSMEDALP
jgi:hypothetical protein